MTLHQHCVSFANNVKCGLFMIVAFPQLYLKARIHGLNFPKVAFERFRKMSNDNSESFAPEAFLKKLPRFRLSDKLQNNYFFQECGLINHCHKNVGERFLTKEDFINLFKLKIKKFGEFQTRSNNL